MEQYIQRAGIDLLLNLTGFNLVGSMGRPQPDRAVALLKSLDVPYLVPLPLLFQTKDQWTADSHRHRADADSAASRHARTGRSHGAARLRGKGHDDDFAPTTATVPARPAGPALDCIAHQAGVRTANRRDNIEFPPDKGSVGSAAYLDVFRSVYNLLVKLRDAGHDVDVPTDSGPVDGAGAWSG